MVYILRYSDIKVLFYLLWQKWPEIGQCFVFLAFASICLFPSYHFTLSFKSQHYFLSGSLLWIWLEKNISPSQHLLFYLQSMLNFLSSLLSFNLRRKCLSWSSLNLQDLLSAWHTIKGFKVLLNEWMMIEYAELPH